MFSLIDEYKRNISMVKFIGSEKGIYTEKCFLADDFSEVLNIYLKDNNLINQIKQLNVEKLTIDDEENLSDKQWMFSNMNCKNIASIFEKNQIYKVVVFHIEDNCVKKIIHGNYIYNTLKAMFENQNNYFLSRQSCMPLYINEEYENVQAELNKEVIDYPINFYFSSNIMLDIINKMMPAFIEYNILNNQSWIDKNNTCFFSELIDLTILYPEKYIDLNGYKNAEMKQLIKKGYLIDYIGNGDGIILDELFNVDFGFFNVDFGCCKKTTYAIKCVKLNEKYTSINIDIRNGIISGNLIGVINDKSVEKDFYMTIDKFFGAIVTGVEKKNIDGNIIADVIINI